MASIRSRKRGNGSTAWAVLYNLNGQQTSTTFDDETTAGKFRDLVDSVGTERAMQAWGIKPTNRAAAPKGFTVGEWLTWHIDHLTGLEQYTLDKYRAYVRNDIAALRDIPLTALTEEDVADWVKGLEAAGAKPKTISNKHGFVSGALGAAVPKHIPANPAAGRKLPRGLGEDADDEMQMLSHDEFDRLVLATAAAWRPLVEFLVVSGCRWGEASALKPSDVDRDAGTVKIRRAWKYSSKGYHIGPPKTKRSRRNIDVDASVLDKLDYTGEWLFTNSGRGRRNSGGPVRYSNFRANVWDPAVSRAKLDPRPTPHDLRHTCASWMLNGGVDLFVVSRHLGHESIKITADVYGDIDRTSTQGAAKLVASRLNSVVRNLDSQSESD